MSERSFGRINYSDGRQAEVIEINDEHGLRLEFRQLPSRSLFRRVLERIAAWGRKR